MLKISCYNQPGLECNAMSARPTQCNWSVEVTSPYTVLVLLLFIQNLNISQV